MLNNEFLYYRRIGKSYREIIDQLGDEGYVVTKLGISSFLKRVEETGSMARKSGSGSSSKKMPPLMKFMDQQMEDDDETTLLELKAKVQELGVSVCTTKTGGWLVH